MIRVALADDEPLALRGMARSLDGIADVEIVGTASDGNTALALIRACSPDLLFLDIQMPGASGLQVAATLAQGASPEVVFVTAHDSYAVEAFALDAVDYLLKPVHPDRLRQSLQRARRRLADRDSKVSNSPERSRPSLYVPDRHGGIDVPQSDIVWIEAARDYGLIHTEHRSFMLRSTMGELAARLREPIVRVHRSSYASLDKVERVETNEKGVVTLVLRDEVKIGVGPSYTKAVRAALKAHRDQTHRS